MKQLTEIQELIDAQRDEIETLKDRLILAQSEALAAIQKNEPEPRDIGHENVISFVTRKSGELQVSPGIVWGLLMDLIAKNTNHFGTDEDVCPEPVEPGSDLWYTEPVDEPKPLEFRVGDLVKIKSSPPLKSVDIETLIRIDLIYKKNMFVLKGFPCYFRADELEFVSRP